jgi:hypothetical protein
MEKTSAKYSSLPTSMLGELNDCVVRAFSIVLDKPYDDLHAQCAKHGRKFAKGTHYYTQRNVAQENGMVEINWNELRNLSPSGEYPTVLQFLKAFPKGRYYVCRNGHAFAIIDGVIHDWARGTGIRSRIVRCFKIKEEIK